MCTGNQASHTFWRTIDTDRRRGFPLAGSFACIDGVERWKIGLAAGWSTLKKSYHDDDDQSSIAVTTTRRSFFATLLIWQKLRLHIWRNNGLTRRLCLLLVAYLLNKQHLSFNFLTQCQRHRKVKAVREALLMLLGSLFHTEEANSENNVYQDGFNKTSESYSSRLHSKFQDSIYLRDKLKNMRNRPATLTMNCFIIKENN